MKRLLSNSLGSAQIIILWLAVLFTLFVVFPFFMFGKIVPPDKIGLRQNYYGIPGLVEKGYQKEGLEPGLQWKIPYISNIVLFPRTFQLVHFNESSQPGDLDLEPLDVPTTDGSKVKTDISLIVRLYSKPGEKPAEKKSEPNLKVETIKTSAEEAAIVPEVVAASASDVPTVTELVPFVTPVAYDHQGPFQLVTQYTTNNEKQLRLFSSVAENELRKHLSSLLTTDYYDPVKREKSAITAQHEINKNISSVGMELWGTLIRRYIYASEIDDQIFQKNLQDQTERLNKANSVLSKIQAETERQLALGDAKIKDLQVTGQSKVQVVRSEGTLYEQKKRAEADLLVASAKAEVDSARAKALSDLSGSDVYLAREISPIIGTLQGGVVTNIDPYDINSWIHKLTGRGNK